MSESFPQNNSKVLKNSKVKSDIFVKNSGKPI
jgi:hypothetical protein